MCVYSHPSLERGRGMGGTTALLAFEMDHASVSWERKGCFDAISYPVPEARDMNRGPVN